MSACRPPMRPEAWKPRSRTPLFSVGALGERESRVMVDWLFVLLVAVFFCWEYLVVVFAWLYLFSVLVFLLGIFSFGCMWWCFGLVLVFGFWFFSSRLFWFQVFLIALFCFGFFRFPA